MSFVESLKTVVCCYCDKNEKSELAVVITGIIFTRVISSRLTTFEKISHWCASGVVFFFFAFETERLFVCSLLLSSFLFFKLIKPFFYFTELGRTRTRFKKFEKLKFLKKEFKTYRLDIDFT